jgi:hypothetical protein
MQALTEQLLKLWYELIGCDHHKDRDCHFYIEKNFSTYLQSKWRLYHRGYLLDEIEEFYETYKEAEAPDQRSETECRVLKKLEKLLEGDDSPADEPSNSERR